MNISFQSDINKLIAKVGNVSKSLKDKVINSSLNDTIKVVNTEVVKTIRADGYNIAAAKIKSRIKITRSTRTSLRARLMAVDKAVNLKEYGAKAYGKQGFKRTLNGQINVMTGGGVSVKVKKSRKRIPHAFISPKTGNVLIRSSKTKHVGKGFINKRGIVFGNGFRFLNERVRPLYGMGINQVVATKAIQAAMEGKATIYFPQRLKHYLNRATM